MSSAPPAAVPGETVITYRPRGAARALFTRRDPELVLAGPAGTGKTYAILQKLHLCLAKYARARALVLRKTLTSLTGSALVTYQEQVRPELDGVTYYGGSAREPAQFRYPNGSRLVLGGMDKASKVLSAEYDVIYVNEATELTEAEWETLTSRLRHGRMPYQQLLGDCNPDKPTHWLKVRADRGQTAMLSSCHEDNPALTPAYRATLAALTGVRRLRLYGGVWAAAEGLVYEEWDPAIHLIDPRVFPRDWPRYWAVDFGYVNPFCCQLWATDADRRLILTRELYRTQRLVQDHAHELRRLVREGEPIPRAIVADHDAEDRATFERHLAGCDCESARGLPLVPVPTTAALKAISPGLQATAARLRRAGDGRPRLFVCRDAPIGRDATLTEKGKPGATAEEFDGYIWDVANGRRKGEVPVDADNHGMDALRYAVMHLDQAGTVGVWVA